MPAWSLEPDREMRLVCAGGCRTSHDWDEMTLIDLKEHFTMKIQEVRTLVAGYSDETLRQLVSEIYKRLPKKVIEEKQIDSLLQNPQDMAAKNRLVRQKELPDLDEVCWETEKFIRDAREQYYSVPNQVIHKSQRPKWRFVAKRLYKSLIDLSQDTENVLETSRLLTELYKVLCEAYRVYLFNTTNPFASVGIEKSEFYSNVVSVIAQTALPEQWIKEALMLTLEPTVTLDHSIGVALIEKLKTAPLKEMAISISEQLRKQNTVPTLYRSNRRYYLEQRNNTLTELIFMLHMALSEKEAAIGDFKSHYKDSAAETILYVLLRQLFNYREKELWLREYEFGLQQMLQPHHNLVAIYTHLKETGDFPQYF